MSDYKKNIFIKILSKGKLPSLPFDKIKEVVLGKKYQLSLVFVPEGISRELNKKYRGLNKTTNILSFPYGKEEGEIIINLKKVKKEAPIFGKNCKNFLGYLLIHGLLHLKGFSHGSIMEKKEEFFVKKFKL